MRLIVDSNILFSAMISDSATREILLNSTQDLYSPDYVKSEIMKYKELITDKSGLSEKEFEVLLNLLLEDIEILPSESYEDHIEEAKELIADQDEKDVPFVAAALEKNASIWSDDQDFNKQEKIQILTTQELIENQDEL